MVFKAFPAKILSSKRFKNFAGFQVLPFLSLLNGGSGPKVFIQYIDVIEPYLMVVIGASLKNRLVTR